MGKTTTRRYPCNRAAMRVFAVIILFASLCTIGADTFKYFPGDYRELIEKLPPPPADDSIAGMADVETLLQVQKDRTPAQIARADFVVVHNAMKMATRIFGPEFTKENLPRTALLMVEMTKERGVIVEAAKEKWNRLRPYKRGLGIEPCVRLSSGTSYPSGHSAAGSLWAVLWSEAFPEFREWFYAEAREIMWCRVLAGVHYPTDTQAGRMLGEMIAAGMLKTPATQMALDEIRAEASEFFQKHPGALAHAREVVRNRSISVERHSAVPVIPMPAKIIQSPSDVGRRIVLNKQHAIVCPDANFGRVAADTFSKWLDVTLPIRPSKTPGQAGGARSIVIDIAGIPGDAGRPAFARDESYALAIAASGDITVRAATRAGAFYALQTLVQLAERGASGFWTLPVLEIRDAPRFALRGILMDEGRHFFGKDAVKQLIDTMVLFKFNTLHWHLTEDQGWRIEIKKYPRLTQIGAWRESSPIWGDRTKSNGIPHGGYYTQDDIREIVAYAKQRHVTIIPEIEMPGHSSAALAAYSQYGNTDIPDYAPAVQTSWGVKLYTFAPKEETFRFLTDILDEVIALFPDSPYIHIGGDEAPKKQWETSAFAQSVMRANNLKDAHELQSWFVRRIEKHLNARGRQLIGWDEIQEGGLSPTAVMMVWRDWKWASHALDKGNKIIMTPKTHCYYDYTPGNVPDNDPYYDNISRYQKPPRVITLEKAYQFEPISEGIRPGQEKQILGCQANLWGEYLYDWRKAEYFLWPRALAMSEVTWSSREARDWTDFQARVPAALLLLDKRGVNYQRADGSAAIELK